ncbi:hypothetical protein Tco_0856910 [Tanacetum coccineum]|uniref:Reverse transcriptase Ty1/copia-type domain-containing protein n=1 Tax=Tanacetum coccineum TaxID=301880 RepID=A0ABQ5B7S3_9ASTR
MELLVQRYSIKSDLCCPLAKAVHSHIFSLTKSEVKDTRIDMAIYASFEKGKDEGRMMRIISLKDYRVYVQVYVDDIIFGSTNKELLQQKEDGIFISQDKYVAEILKKFNYSDVKSASTPVDLEKPLVKDGDADDVDVHLYRSKIGSLMYLTASRPDIMFAVCACARFQVTPKTSHLLALTSVGATQDRKSTTGGCQFLGNRLLSWQCKKQTVVATSTTEAEYVAAASCCSGPRCQDTILGDVHGSNKFLLLVYFNAAKLMLMLLGSVNAVRHMLMLPVQVPAAEDIMADLNIPVEQAPAVAPPTKTDDQILPLSNCQLDEQWFNLHKDILRDALNITPSNDNNPFVAPPSSDTVIEYVNTLRYPSTLKNVSAMSVNALYQPWRAILSMINMCLTGKTAGFDRPRHPTFLTDKKNLAMAACGKKKTAHLLIPSVRFTKLIIHHLRTKHNILPRTGSPLHYSYEESILNTLSFVRKDGREIFGMLILDALLTDEIKGAPYYTPKPTATQPPKPKPAPTQPSKAVSEKKRKLVKETPDEPSPAKRSKGGLVTKKRKPKSPLKLVDEPSDEGVFWDLKYFMDS